jgi:hypothetical protein
VSATPDFDIYLTFHSFSPGCLLCHRMLLPCQERIKDGWTPKPHDELQAALKRLQSYPDSDVEILSTWEARNALWEEFKPLTDGRKHNCRAGKRFLPTKLIDADLY